MIKPSALRQQAGSILEKTPYCPKKLVLIHTAIALGSSLLISLLSYLLDRQIAGTGGLGGMGLRSLLSTAQTMLELTVLVVLPFWDIGLIYASLRWAKGENATPPNLLQGFRRVGAVLGANLLQGALYIAIGFAVSYLCVTIYMMTPFSRELIELFEPFLQPGITVPEQEALMTPEFMEALFNAYTPLLICSAVLFVLVSIPVFYRLRFAQLAVMDGFGPFASLLRSNRLAQYNCFWLFKLDLQFWRFYLLLILCLAISYGDNILRLLGVALPFSRDVSFFLFTGVGAICQGALLWQCQAPVLTSYALAYLHGPYPPAEETSQPEAQ